jgi:hypothetical protein
MSDDHARGSADMTLRAGLETATKAFCSVVIGDASRCLPVVQDVASSSDPRPRTFPAVARMSRVSWNFGGGPMIIRWH